MSAFPQISSPFVDGNRQITDTWRRFLTSLWQSAGGQDGGLCAPAAGNQNQTFNVATAISASNAVPLAQADSRYASIGGNQTQTFFVGNASPGSNMAIRRAQVEALFPSFLGAGAAIQTVTLTGSPFAYTAATGGTLCVSGGTVSGVTLNRGGSIPVATGNIPVRAGDVVTITYSAAPTVNFVPL